MDSSCNYRRFVKYFIIVFGRKIQVPIDVWCLAISHVPTIVSLGKCRVDVKHRLVEKKMSILTIRYIINNHTLMEIRTCRKYVGNTVQEGNYLIFYSRPFTDPWTVRARYLTLVEIFKIILKIVRRVEPKAVTYVE